MEFGTQFVHEKIMIIAQRQKNVQLASQSAYPRRKKIIELWR
jgi:hypothetical protein